MTSHKLSQTLKAALIKGSIVQINPYDFIVLCEYREGFGKPEFKAKLSLFEFFGQELVEENTFALKVRREDLLTELLNLISDEIVEPNFTEWEEPDFPNFKSDVELILSEINSGNLMKAVPIISRKRKSGFSISERIHSLVSALKRSPESSYIYFWSDKDRGILGVTPEVLFSKKDLYLESIAIAGSMPKESGDEESLKRDPKELHENQLVVDFIEKQLSELGAVKTSPLQVRELPKLFHLFKTIQLELKKEIEGSTLVKVLHPTPALGISSHQYNYHWMEVLNNQSSRKWFGAPLLVEFENQSLALVCIRNIIWQKEYSKIYAGCGIVNGSVVEKEWREVLTKIESVRNLLDI